MQGHQPATADGRWALHEARAGAIVSRLDTGQLADQGIGPAQRSAATDWAERVGAAPPEVLLSTLLLMLRRDQHTWTWLVSREVAKLLRRPFPVPAVDALLAARTVLAAPRGWYFGVSAKVAATLLQRADGQGGDAVPVVAAALAEAATAGELTPADRRAIHDRLLPLLPRNEAELNRSAFLVMDGWASAAIAVLEAPADLAAANGLLDVLMAAKGSRPSKTWHGTCRAALESPGARRAVRVLLDQVVNAPAKAVQYPYFGEFPVVLDDRNGDLVRAAAWAAALVEADWVVPMLEAATRRAISDRGFNVLAMSSKVPNALVLALGQVATPAAVAALLRLRDSTHRSGIHTKVDAALEAAGVPPGSPPASLPRLSSPRAGLARMAASKSRRARSRPGSPWAASCG